MAKCDFQGWVNIWEDSFAGQKLDHEKFWDVWKSENTQMDARCRIFWKLLTTPTVLGTLVIDFELRFETDVEQALEFELGYANF